MNEQEGEMFSEMSIRYAAEMQRDHYRELLRAAQVDQALRQAWPRSSWRIPLAWKAFLWLGKWLVNWGLRLQQRYSPAARLPEASGVVLDNNRFQTEIQGIRVTQPELEICLN